ncbi:PLP-dependent transferase [Kiritimatiella glycovorans]|uniref:Cystathionine gamma-synthase n=1 Tax=Kiritimatiella glycovorans TaxID=1307763 RepID=A0A0G3EAC9_9BACT|nr:PLP-dependent transferase [Kiritimatiella glycovorans]AKJ63401.1 cystathionine gamma-synthase [Kiritimatiella glycovorans]
MGANHYGDPLTPYGNRPMVTPIVHCPLTTMLYMPEERRNGFGVERNTVRLSAGIEDTALLLEDLDQALDAI